jgi:hypothetical protein
VAGSRSTAANRLGLDDWIQAGYAPLAEEGRGAVGRHQPQLADALALDMKIPRTAMV